MYVIRLRILFCLIEIVLHYHKQGDLHTIEFMTHCITVKTEIMSDVIRMRHGLVKILHINHNLISSGRHYNFFYVQTFACVHAQCDIVIFKTYVFS